MDNAANDYYNSFYRELARLDEQGNSISKLEGILPSLAGGMQVLDIGCGHGSVGADFVKRGCRVAGMEINRDAIASLRAKGIEPIECDITRPFELQRAFELVLLLDVLEHVFDPVALLREARKTLKPDGALLITVPLYFDLSDRLRILFKGRIVSYDNLVYGRELYNRFRSYNYDHIRFFQPKDVLEMVELAGLRVDKVVYGPIWGVDTLSRVLSRLSRRPFLLNRWPQLFAHTMSLRVKL